MKKLLSILILIAFISIPAFAQIWYLRIPSSQLQTYMDKLDVLKGPSLYTLHYTAPIEPVVPESTTDVLLPVDERAQSVLTAEEWESKLSVMPEEFQRPLPK